MKFFDFVGQSWPQRPSFDNRCDRHESQRRGAATRGSLCVIMSRLSFASWRPQRCIKTSKSGCVSSGRQMASIGNVALVRRKTGARNDDAARRRKTFSPARRPIRKRAKRQQNNTHTHTHTHQADQIIKHARPVAFVMVTRPLLEIEPQRLLWIYFI